MMNRLFGAFIATICCVLFFCNAVGDELGDDIQKAEYLLQSLRSPNAPLDVDALKKTLKSDDVAAWYDKYSGENWFDYTKGIERRISTVERTYKKNARPKASADGMIDVVEATLSSLKKQKESTDKKDVGRKELEAKIADFEKQLAEHRKALEKEKAEDKARLSAANKTRDENLLAIAKDMAARIEEKAVKAMKAKQSDQKKSALCGVNESCGAAIKGGGQLEVMRNEHGVVVGLMGCVLGEDHQFDDFTFGEKVREGIEFGDEHKTYVYELQKKIYGFTHIRLGVSKGDERLVSIHLLAPVKNSSDVNRITEEIRDVLQSKEGISFTGVRKGDNGYLDCIAPPLAGSGPPVALRMTFEYQGDGFFEQGVAFGAVLTSCGKVVSRSPQNAQSSRETSEDQAVAPVDQSRELKAKAAAELAKARKVDDRAKQTKLVLSAMKLYACAGDLEGVVSALSFVLERHELELPDIYELLYLSAQKATKGNGEKILGAYDYFLEKHKNKYERTKAWYKEQLRYNALVEQYFQRCLRYEVWPSYYLSFYREDSSGSVEINVDAAGGGEQYISYPNSMAKGFAEELASAREYIYCYENPKANIEERKRIAKDKKEAREAAEAKKTSSYKSYVPRKRKINPDLKRFKGPGDR